MSDYFQPHGLQHPWLPLVHHQLPQLAQTHVHRVSDAIQPSQPLSPPSPPAFNLSQHQGLFQWVSSSHRVAKLLAFRIQHRSLQWVFRTDFLYDWLIWSPFSPRNSQRSSPTPRFKRIILRHSGFLIGQISHPHTTTRNTIALTRQIFVGKVISLLFNMLSRLVISFLPRSKYLWISWLHSLSVVILEPKKKKACHCFHSSPSIFHELLGWDTMILVFWVLSFKPAFSLSSFMIIKRLFNSSSPSV